MTKEERYDALIRETRIKMFIAWHFPVRRDYITEAGEQILGELKEKLDKLRLPDFPELYSPITQIKAP